MSDTERRKGQRAKGHIRVAYGKTRICVSDLTDDLSPTGVLVRTPYPLEIGTDVHIEIEWNPGKAGKKSEILRLEGRVARVHDEPSNPGMALTFTNLTPEDSEKISRWIQELQRGS